MKILIVTVILLTGCSTIIPVDSNDPVYKYNVFENRYELTDEKSRLMYNVYERKWEFN